MPTSLGQRGLLLMSSKCSHLTSRVKQCLTFAKERTCDTLFVYLLKDSQESHSSMNSEPLADVHDSVAVLSHATRIVYSQASALCPSIDVRLLFRKWDVNSSSCKQSGPVPKLSNLRAKSLQWILAESCLSKQDVDQFLQSVCHGKPNDTPSVDIVNAPLVQQDNTSSLLSHNGQVLKTDDTFKVVVLGGTFDRLHNGHKVLLTESAIRCTCEIIVGVTDDTMIKKKSLHEMILPTETRIEFVKEFLQDIAPSLVDRVVPISDPFGPAITDENIQLIVVSEETIQGAHKINELRTQNHFPPLLIHTIPIFEETARENEQEEAKISSSSKRLRLLGKRLKPPVTIHVANSHYDLSCYVCLIFQLKTPCLPYVIGLTGGIASGKTNIRQYLAEVRNIQTIDCDKLGHEAYLPGTSCFRKIVEVFGQDLVMMDGKIDRKLLGSKVFGNAAELRKLTDIVWPEIRALTESGIESLGRAGARIIVVEAAVLAEAGWNPLYHDIWVSFIPREEAIMRVMGRDSVSAESASKKLDSQLPNGDRLKLATFAFSSLWDVEFTRMQIDKALADIQGIVDELKVECRDLRMGPSN